MKKTSIEVGKKYTDNKGNVREVLAVGEMPELCPGGRQETNCVKYKITRKQSGPYLLWSVNITTLVSFASWAKGEVA